MGMVEVVVILLVLGRWRWQRLLVVRSRSRSRSRTWSSIRATQRVEHNRLSGIVGGELERVEHRSVMMIPDWRSACDHDTHESRRSVELRERQARRDREPRAGRERLILRDGETCCSEVRDRERVNRRVEREKRRGIRNRRELSSCGAHQRVAHTHLLEIRGRDQESIDEWSRVRAIRRCACDVEREHAT